MSSLSSSAFIILNIFIATVSAASFFPEDVELVHGQLPPSHRFNSPAVGRTRLETPRSGVYVKAIRNRRALEYHIKSVPNINEYYYEDDENPVEILPNHFVKRDIADLTNMDVSAQYMEQLAIDHVNPKSKREVIEEEDIKNGNRREEVELTQSPKVEQWIPQGSGPTAGEQEDLFGPITSETKSTSNSSPSSITAEALTDKQNGRGARGATKDQWIKLPFLARPLENDQLSSTSTNLEEANHRMPRVNFVTQGKGLQTSESRNERESVPRSSFSRSTDLRTDIYPPNKDRARSLDYSTYSRRNYYYPDDYRRPSYEDYGSYDDYYNQGRRDPYDRYDYKNSRRYDYGDYYRNRDPYDRYDGYDDNSYYRNDKPRRIIYYANLPDVARTPPNVYRYSSNPYNRYDDDRYNRDSRYYNDYRDSGYPSSRYPYSALKKAENEGPRDLTSSSTANKEKSESLKRQQELRKNDNSDRSRDGSLNSHQYPVSLSTNMNVGDTPKSPHQTLYHDITRQDSDFHRYDHPSFQAAVDDPYISRHD